MVFHLYAQPLSSQLISQEPNQGVEYEFYLPNGRSREGYYWSFGSWSVCSRECGSGQSLRKTQSVIETCLNSEQYLCKASFYPASSTLKQVILLDR